MKNKTFRPFCLLFMVAVLLLSTGPVCRAIEIIGINISSPKNSNQNYLYPADFAGAPGARTNNWNNLLAASDGASANITVSTITNSGGAAVAGMSVTLHPSGGGVYNRGAGGTNDTKMFLDVADTYACTGFGNFGYLDITNIPYTNYNIYCYFLPDNGSGSANTRGGFWLITNTPAGSQRYYIQNQSNDVAQTQEPVPSTSGGNYVQSTTTSIPSGGAAWSSIQGGNYAVFSGLTNSWTRVWFGGLGNGSGGVDDLGHYVTGGSAAVRFKVCGFQIVQVPSGNPTRLYLQSSNLTLHAGNPVGTQLTVLADLDTGATGVNETTASGISYSVDNTAVATVSASGVLTAGTNGTANLIVSYKGLSLTNAVSVIGPTSLSISVSKTNLLAGNGQGDTATAVLIANFSDAVNVSVNSYKYVSFSTATPSVITVNTNGTITALGAGSFSVTGTYDGLSATTNNAGTVTAYSAPGGQAVSVNLTDISDLMSFHDLSGAPGVRMAYWNNMVLSGGSVSNNVVAPYDAQGNIQANMTVTLVASAGSGGGMLTSSTRTTNESVMFNTMFDQGYNNANGIVTLQNENQIIVSNVPYSNYDVYFYCWNDPSNTNRSGFFRLTSESANTNYMFNGTPEYPERWRRNDPSLGSAPDNLGNRYEEAVPLSVNLPASVAAVPVGNYIHFPGCTNSTLTVQWSAGYGAYFTDGDNTERLRLSGFQIVKSLVGLTATNIYLSAPVGNLFPGNPATVPLVVLGDFTDGTKGGTITSLSGITFASSNPNVFGVSSSGVVSAGLTPGTATLTVTYQTNVLDVSVTNLSPTSVTVKATPAVVYLDGVLNITTSQASVYVNFPGYTNVNASSFASVSYVDQGSSAATLSSAGAITAVASGTANLGVSYLGTTSVTTNAFRVSSTNNAPTLVHRYSFRDTAGSTTIADSIGNATGTIFPSLGTNQSIRLDGERAIFPGDGTYANCPYISLPAGLLDSMGDLTIEMWVGTSNNVAWERFFAAGNTSKGTDPHTYPGNSASGLQFLPVYGGTPIYPDFSMKVSSSVAQDIRGTNNWTAGVEHQVVLVWAPNTGISAYYLDGVLVTNSTPLAGYTLSAINDTVDWLGVSLDNNDPPLNGWFDDLRIYEGAMSALQVSSDYAAGASSGLTSPISTSRTNITTVVSGNSLQLSWPSDHIGWRLQVQTNSLGSGLGTNWYDWPGSTGTNSVTIPIVPGNPSVFFRMVYP